MHVYIHFPIEYHLTGTPLVNTLRPRQHVRHFADDVFECICLNENVWISNMISLKFVPNDPINNNPALVQIMAWRRPGNKPLSKPMMVNLLTHLCVTRPQWVNTWTFNITRIIAIGDIKIITHYGFWVLRKYVPFWSSFSYVCLFTL